MPATSSAPGSQPQSVARRNARTQRRQILDAVDTAQQIGEAATGVARSIRRGSRAVQTAQLVASGASPQQVARASGTSAAVRRDARKAARLRKVAKAKQKTVKRAIKEDPPKAEKLVQQSTKRIWERLDVKGKGPAPKIELGQHTKAVTAHKPTVQIEASDAKKFFSPAPKVRKAARRTVVKEAVKAEAKVEPKPPKKAKVGVEVPEIVPPRYRKAVAKQGQQLNEALKKTGSDLTGPEYLAKMIQFESGWNPNAENPSSAKGLGQFIDSTAESFRRSYGVETQDPAKPNQMIKGAAMHASGRFGHAPLYAGYNPGYSSTDPIPAVDSGPNVKVKVARKAVKKLSAGTPPQASSAPQKLPGPESGSREVVRKLTGTKVRGDHGVKNEGTVHSADGDHYDPNSYAQDINQPGGNTAEGEPPYNQATLNRIVTNARKFGFKNIPNLKIGENYEGTANGYRLQLLTNEGGTVNHIHVGVRYVGAGTTSTGGSYGTAGGSVPVSAGGTPVLTSGGLTTAPSGSQRHSSRGKKSRQRAKRMEGRQRSRLLRKLIAEGPVAAEEAVKAPSYAPTERTKVTVEL